MPRPSGLFCPACDRQGIESELIADLRFHKCPQNHQYPSYAQLMALKPRMRPLVVNEKQPVGTVTMSVWVYPEAQHAMAARFPNNLQTTLCSLMTALADGDTFIVEGEHVRELRELGHDVSHGRDVVGLARTNKQLQQALDEARMQQRVLEPFMKLLAGAVHGAGGAGGGAAAGGQQSAISEGEPYEQEAFAAVGADGGSAALLDPGETLPATSRQPVAGGQRGIPRPLPSGR